MNKLRDLGYDEWFAAGAGAVIRPGELPARVVAVDRGAYLVNGERGEATAELAGRFRYAAASGSELPCVGDWVSVAPASRDLAIIHAVLPRKTVLWRKCPGKIVDLQMIAANLDVAFIVQSCHFDFNVRRLERYLAAASEGRIEPVIVLSKTDLVPRGELQERIGRIRAAGITRPIVPISNLTGDGLDAFLERLLPGKTFGLLGSSGVGKSTLVNRLLGREAMATREVSGTGEGVHTTARRQMFVLDNGALLMDTPGMRELGLVGAGDGVEDSFADIHDLSETCRFSDCTHTREPGCGVLAAIEAGDLEAERYRSYLKLKKETEYHDLSYVAKRKKDRDFGRFVKSVQKRRKR